MNNTSKIKNKAGPATRKNPIILFALFLAKEGN